MIIAPRIILCLLVFLSAASSFAQRPTNRADSKGRQGVWKTWLTRSYSESDDSTIAPYYRICSYKDGMARGPFKDYYRSQKIHREGEFKTKDGKVYIDGTVKTYRENGGLEIIEQYVNGIRHGTHSRYSINGALVAKGEFDGGARSGEWITYYENGAIKSRGAYSGGDQDGAWTTYLEDGSTKETILFYQGRQVDWSELLRRAENSINEHRLDDAQRSIQAAADVILSTFGEKSPPAARLQFVRARFEAANGRSRSAIKHLDTAISNCNAIGASARSTMHAGLDKVTSFAIDQQDAAILDYLIPIVRTENRRLEPTTLYYAKSFATLEIAYACMRRDSTTARQAIEYASFRIRASADDSSAESAKDLYRYWMKTAEKMYRIWYPQLALLCLETAHTDKIRLKADVLDSIRSECAAIEIYAIANDTSLSEPQRTKDILSVVDKYKEGDRTKYCYLLLDAAFTSNEVDMARGVAERCSGDCLERIPSQLTIVFHAMTALAAVEQLDCDKAEVHLEEAVRLNTDKKSDILIERLRQRIIRCRNTTGSDSLLSAPQLFFKHVDTLTASMETTIRMILPERADIYINALAPTATGEDMLTALINADTLDAAIELTPFVSSYRSILDKMRPLVRGHKGPVQRASTLFKALHDSVFKKYVESIPLRSVLIDGQFNCASAVALYGMLCRDLDIPVIYYDAPYHITCGIPDQEQVVLVELTSPQKGFNFIQERDSVLQLLREFKLVTQEEIDDLGADSVYRSYRDHRRAASFESVLRAAFVNTRYRSDLWSTDESLQNIEHSLLPLILDSASEDNFIFFSIISLADTAVLTRVIQSFQSLTQYYHGNPRFFSTNVLSLLRTLQYLQEKQVSFDAEPLYQAIYDHAPLHGSQELTSSFNAFVAASRAAQAERNGHLDTAYAYLVTYTPDSLRTWHPSYYRIAGAFIDQLTAQYRYDLALRVARQEYDDNKGQPSIALFCYSLLNILSSTAIREMKPATYSEILNDAFREFASLATPVENQNDWLSWLVNRAVLFNRHEYGDSACVIARRYRIGMGVLPAQETSLRVMRTNLDLAVNLDQIKIRLSVRIGGGDGPETDIISGLDALMYLRLDVEGLKIGQVITLESEFRGGGDVPRSNPIVQFGASDTTMRFWVDIPLEAYRNRKGPVKIIIRVNDTEIEPLSVNIQPH